MGAPVKPDTADKVALVIEAMRSGQSENAACIAAGLSRSTFRSAALREGIGDKYAGALSALAGAQAEKLEQAIDDMRAGTIDAQMARVEIDARKWFASKFLPARYGDKVQLADADGGKLPPIAFNVFPTTTK